MTEKVAVELVAGIFTVSGIIVSTIGMVMIKKAKKNPAAIVKQTDLCKIIHKNIDSRFDKMEHVQDDDRDRLGKLEKDMIRLMAKFGSDASSSLNALANAANLIQRDYEALRKKITGEKVIYDDDVRG